MGRQTVTPTPSLRRRTANFGENLRSARLRRRFTAALVAERAGITRPTLRAIEQGDPSVSFGAYASVLFCLGLDADMDALANDDELGRKLQDAGLTTPRSARRGSLPKPPGLSASEQERLQTSFRIADVVK